MVRLPALVLLAVLAGCGGRATDVRRGPERDPAAELAARLPASLGRCAVTRVSRVPSSRRAAFAELSLAGTLAFEPGAPVEAVAVASDGSSRAAPFVALYRTRAEPAVVRRFFESGGRARLAFDEGSLCEHGICRPVDVAFVEPTLLRVATPFVDVGSGKIGSRCADMLREDTGAIEVAAWTEPRARRGLPRSSPISGEWSVRARAGGLRVTRVERYASPRFAATAARLESVLPPEPGWIQVAEPSTRVAVGSEVRFTADLAFRDLALRARDVDRMRRALAAELAFAWRVVPADAIDYRRYEIVDRQVYVRRERLGAARGEEARELGIELVAVLDRALAVHPTEERLAATRFEVLLAHVGDPRAAADAAERALAGHPEDPAVWRARRREALVRFDLDAAGAALEEAGIAGEGGGRDAAVALRAMLGDAYPVRGAILDYPLAEASIARALRLSAAEPPPTLAEPFAVEWHAVAETALALLELRASTSRAERLVAVVHGALDAGEEPEFPFLEIAPAAGVPRRIAVAPIDDRGALRAFGRAFAHAIGQGESEIRFALVGVRDGDSAGEVAFRGSRTDDGLRVSALRAPPSELGRIARLVAGPLARMHPFRRPPPAFFVEATSAEERRTLLLLAADVPGLACAPRQDEDGVVCRSTLRGAALRRAWLDVVRPLLAP